MTKDLINTTPPPGPNNSGRLVSKALPLHGAPAQFVSCLPCLELLMSRIYLTTSGQLRSRLCRHSHLIFVPSAIDFVSVLLDLTLCVFVFVSMLLSVFALLSCLSLPGPGYFCRHACLFVCLPIHLSFACLLPCLGFGDRLRCSSSVKAPAKTYEHGNFRQPGLSLDRPLSLVGDIFFTSSLSSSVSRRPQSQLAHEAGPVTLRDTFVLLISSTKPRVVCQSWHHFGAFMGLSAELRRRVCQ
ncbi:unnamed protein product [Protopolystoma xenopodis]|uniref:Uncharacterized protein n=1 Tax=Protopolystoma xenopodis TaxID=117903 RepID=A0A448X083_9PLAT|nr:unnamed protein product [Protopolystoma xenopodis]